MINRPGALPSLPWVPVEHGAEIDPADVVTESLRALRDPGDKPGLHVRLFGTPNFFRLWLAQVVSSLGDWLGFLAIATLATRVGGGNAGAAVGLVMTARLVPGFFLGPLAGVLVDRWDRKKVMVTCDLCRAVLLCCLPFVDTVAGLVFASLLMEVFTLLWSPAKEASVPNLVPPDRLASANSLSLGAAYGTFPVASVLFTVLASIQNNMDVDVLRLGEEGTLAFYVDALTFCVSAILIYTLALGPPERAGDAARDDIDATSGIKATMREFREGWSFIFFEPHRAGGQRRPRHRAHRRRHGRAARAGVLRGGARRRRRRATASSSPPSASAPALGIISVSVTGAASRSRPSFTVAVFGAAVALGFAASTSLARSRPRLRAAGFGLCAGIVYVIGFTLLHEHVDDELRGRIFGALYMLVRLCLLIAFAVGPFLAGFLDKLSANLFTDRTSRALRGRGVPPRRAAHAVAGVLRSSSSPPCSRRSRSEPSGTRTSRSASLSRRRVNRC